MTDKMIVCLRCDGRKKIYKIGGGYSFVNIGGQLVNCPMCNGEGKHKTAEAALKEIEEIKDGEEKSGKGSGGAKKKDRKAVQVQSGASEKDL